MAMAGNTFETLLREVWTRELFTTVFQNSFMFDQSIFPIVAPPGGSAISSGYEYSITSTTGEYNYDDPMNEPYVSSQVKAYFNKTHLQEAARVFGVYLDYNKNGGTEVELDAVRQSLKTGTENLLDKASTTMITAIEAQIDEAAAYSDASLSRTTYATLKSYEEDTSAALSLAYLEDMFEALMTHTTYGQNVRDTSDLVLLMPRNQLTNLSRLVTGASNFQFNADSQNLAKIDAGRVQRVAQFEGADIIIVPDMTTTTVLAVHKPDTKIYETRGLTIKEKQEKADTQLWHLTCAYDLVVHRPGNSGKLSDKTA